MLALFSWLMTREGPSRYTASERMTQSGGSQAAVRSSVKVGDLVRVENSYVNRIGIIVAKAEQNRCYLVQFCDDNSPIRCSYHVNVIRRISESR